MIDVIANFASIFSLAKVESADIIVQKGKNRIKIVGNNANGEVNMKVKLGNSMKIYEPEKE